MAAATLPAPSAASPEREEREYFLLYDAFVRLLDCWTDSAARHSALEMLVEMRAGTLIGRLLDGLGLDLEQALEVLKRRDDFPTQQERERREKERREAAERTKRVFTVVVCIILVLALGIPTVGLAFLGGGAS